MLTHWSYVFLHWPFDIYTFRNRWFFFPFDWLSEEVPYANYIPPTAVLLSKKVFLLHPQGVRKKFPSYFLQQSLTINTHAIRHFTKTFYINIHTHALGNSQSAVIRPMHVVCFQRRVHLTAFYTDLCYMRGAIFAKQAVAVAQDLLKYQWRDIRV